MEKLEYQGGADRWINPGSIWDRLLGPDRRRVWSAFAREIGGRYCEWGPLAKPMIVAPIGSLSARLDRVKRGGRSRTWHLRCCVRYCDANGFRFAGWAPASHHQPEWLRQAFSRQNERYEPRFTGRIRVDVRDINWWFGWKPGRAELYVCCPGDTRDIQELRDIFNLTRLVMDRLRANGSIAERSDAP